MAFDTLAARNRDTGRWHTALAVSLSLHIAGLVYAVTASTIRRDKPAAAPIVFTVLPEQATPLPPQAALAAEAPAAAPGRAGKPTVRPRSNRAANRLAPPPPAPPSAGRQPTAAVVESPAGVEAPSLQGDVQVASAQTGSGAGLAGGEAPAAQGSEVNAAPRILPPAQGNGQLAIDPNEARYQPVIPPPLRKPGAKFAPLVKLCVRKDGSVGNVTVMRPSDPAVDPAIVEKIRLFKFRPYLDHGRPIPFCFFREYRLSVEE
jgi:hypothetical protein